MRRCGKKQPTCAFLLNVTKERKSFFNFLEIMPIFHNGSPIFFLGSLQKVTSPIRNSTQWSRAGVPNSLSLLLSTLSGNLLEENVYMYREHLAPPPRVSALGAVRAAACVSIYPDESSESVDAYISQLEHAMVQYGMYIRRERMQDHPNGFDILSNSVVCAKIAIQGGARESGGRLQVLAWRMAFPTSEYHSLLSILRRPRSCGMAQPQQAAFYY